MIASRYHLFVALLIVLAAPTAVAQTGGAPAAAGATQTGGGATTQGGGGATTQGFGSTATTGGASTTTPGGFVGGNSLDNFIGGLVDTDRITRQFQTQTQSTVPSGGNRATGGTARIKRSTLRIAFSHPASNQLPFIRQRQQRVFNNMSPVRPGLRSIGFTISQEGIATVTGSVPNADSRRLAANLLRLEPGIRRVNNQLAISLAP